MNIAKSEEKDVVTVESLGGWDKCVHLCAPAGIGDISWAYSKIRHIRELTGREVILSVAKCDPHRGGPFVQLLPDVHWGGYIERESWEVISQTWPHQWRAHQSLGFICDKPFVQNVSANLHLELGRPLSEIWPALPTDYHYPIKLSEADYSCVAPADAPRPWFCYYVSNRQKDSQRVGGWHLWQERDWVTTILDIHRTFDGTAFFVGAEYDRDKTEGVYNAVADDDRAPECRMMIGRPLKDVLALIRDSNYFLHYPGGLGILANVLRTPGCMLLPWLLEGLETSYADPVDLEYQRYRAWASPTRQQFLHWFYSVGIYQGGLA